MNRHPEHTKNRDASPVSRLSEAQVSQVVDVLCDAFHSYPVMRYVAGPADADYDRRLRTLITFFVMARIYRHEPMLGVYGGSALVAAATLTLPGKQLPPAQLVEHREAVWRELGEAARKRYEAFGEATQTFDIHQPHHHLDMIGVRRSHHGKGLSRQLLEAVHIMSQSDPASSGVTLTTEDRRNVSLYEHFGYEIIGNARIDAQLETWGFFRPNDKKI